MTLAVITAKKFSSIGRFSVILCQKWGPIIVFRMPTIFTSAVFN